MNETRLIVVDISSFIFRAFYAIRPLNAPDGTPVNAVSGVLSMLLKLLSQYRPTHIVIAQDSGRKTFRTDLYPEYKANRSEPPDDLKPQFGLIKELVDKMQLLSICKDGYEADDVIGSVCRQWKNYFDEILIISGDKDLMQFVDDKVFMLDTMKDIRYDRNAVFEKFGVYPEQIVDYLSIVGDSSDNVPGLKGIGPKGATSLLEQYKTLENIKANSDKLTGKKNIEAFSNNYQDAVISKQLISIVDTLDLETEASIAKYQFYPHSELINFLKQLGFKSAIQKLLELKQIDDSLEGPQKITVEVKKPILDVALHDGSSSQLQLEANSVCAIYVDNENIFCTTDGKNIWKKTIELDFFKEVSNKSVCIVSDNLKQLLWKINNAVSIQAFDLSVAHFVLDQSSKHDLDTLCVKFFGSNTETPEQKCAQIFALYPVIKDKLKENQLLEVYERIDGPLIPVLVDLEMSGVMINSAYLEELEMEYERLLENVELEIKKASGISNFDYNLKSPKQVAQLLFEDLGLPIIKKTKTGFSTDSSVLEELDALGTSPIPALLLQYRELEKLLSTYVKTLPSLVSQQTGRLHTTFTQDVAATGRLSSINPNLQNIPIKTDYGRKIRKAFMATPGKLLVSADYSQVELRLLAHFSSDKNMVEAFKNDLDIHTQTAATVLDITLDKVTNDERSKAKAVNFGLMYGQSSFGLAQALRISRAEAKDFIENYFTKFSGVKLYLDGLKEVCERTGFAQTLHGRKRFLPDIHSANRNIKAHAERMAINSPIQGTAADIIKLAMINIDRRLKDEHFKTKMLLQVHDELIFETQEDELSRLMTLIRKEMESVVELQVPLRVDIGIGVNWYDMKSF